MLGARDADRDRQAELVADARGGSRCAIAAGGPNRCVAAGDVGEGLVDRDALDQRREVVEDVDRGIAEPLVFLEVAADEDQVAGRARCARRPGMPPRTPKALAS